MMKTMESGEQNMVRITTGGRFAHWAIMGAQLLVSTLMAVSMCGAMGSMAGLEIAEVVVRLCGLSSKSKSLHEYSLQKSAVIKTVPYFVTSTNEVFTNVIFQVLHNSTYKQC